MALDDAGPFGRMVGELGRWGASGTVPEGPILRPVVVTFAKSGGGA